MKKLTYLLSDIPSEDEDFIVCHIFQTGKNYVNVFEMKDNTIEMWYERLGMGTYKIYSPNELWRKFYQWKNHQNLIVV